MSSCLAHDEKSKVLEIFSKVVGSAGEVRHDGAVAVLAKTNQLVVLANDLRSALGEVQGERSLVRAKVIDVEHELFGEEFRRAPNNPANTRIDLSDC